MGFFKKKVVMEAVAPETVLPTAAEVPASKTKERVSPNAVCEEHRIIGCRKCWPPEEPAKPVEPATVAPPVDANSLVACVWLMYKLDIITRIQVRDFLNLIKAGKWPSDMVKYLQDEVKKIG